jgi:hypothetical protein
MKEEKNAMKIIRKEKNRTRVEIKMKGKFESEEQGI